MNIRRIVVINCVLGPLSFSTYAENPIMTVGRSKGKKE